jgi:hypothetical protein
MITYYGGAGDDSINAMAFTGNRPLRIAGSTTSADLESKNAWQLQRDSGLEGFVADITVPYLNLAESVLVTRGTTVTIGWRYSQSLANVPITIRLSDPSKVRFVNTVSPNLAETTNIGQLSVSLEGLEDSGSSDLTITAPGFPTRTLRVVNTRAVWALRDIFGGPLQRLLPGTQTAAQVYLAVLDPASGRPTQAGNVLLNPTSRPFPDLVAQPNIVSVAVQQPFLSTSNNVNISATAVGDTVLRLADTQFGMFPEAGFPISVVRPRVAIVGQVPFAARNLRTVVNVSASNGPTFPTGRGDFRVESSDPSRLLVSFTPRPTGLPVDQSSVSNPFSNGLIFLYGQANSGTATVRLSSPSIEEDLVFDVLLTPVTVVPFFVNQPERNVSLSLEAMQRFDIGFRFALPGTSIRPNSFTLLSTSLPPTLGVRVSNTQLFREFPTQVALDSGFGSARYQVAATGTSTISFVAPNDSISVSRELNVDVGPGRAVQTNASEILRVGRGLYQNLQFNIASFTQFSFTCLVDDPAIGAVSTRSDTPPAAQASGTTDRLGACQVHAIAAEGDTALRIRVPNCPDQIIPVRIVPSGFAFDRENLFLSFYAAVPTVPVRIYALHESTLLPLEPQFPRPNSPWTARIRVEGTAASASNIDCAAASMGLEGICLLTITPRAVGDAVLRLDQGAGLTDPKSHHSLLVRFVASAFNVLGTDASKGMLSLMQPSISPILFNQLAPSITIRSLNPDRLLLSTSVSAPGAESLVIPAQTQRAQLYLHGLADSGTARVRLEAVGVEPLEVTVRLSAWRLVANSNPSTRPIAEDLPVGSQATINFNIATEFGTFLFGPQPGTVIPLVLRNSDADIVRVNASIARFEPGIGSGNITVVALRPGTSEISLEADGRSSPPLRANVRLPRLVTRGLMLFENFEAFARFSVEQFAAPPADNSIVTVRSTNPAILRLARTSGSATSSESVDVVWRGQNRESESVVLHVFPGPDTDSQPGAVVAGLEVSLPGYDSATIPVSLARASFAFGSDTQLNLTVGDRRQVSVGPVFNVRPPDDFTSSIPGSYRPGFAAFTIPLRASDRQVIDAPNEVRINTNTPGTLGANVEIRATAPGTSQLTLGEAPGFALQPSLRDTVSVNVLLPRMEIGCSQRFVPYESYTQCTLRSAPNVNVSLRSLTPSTALLAPDARTDAASSLFIATRGSSEIFVVHGLGRSGTSRIQVSAPGFETEVLDLRNFDTAFVLNNPSSSTAIPLRVNQTLSGSIVMVSFDPDQPLATTPTPGLRFGTLPVRVPIAFGTPGIVSATPSDVLFAPQSAVQSFTLTGVRDGTTTVRAGTPAGFGTNPAGIVLIRVTP